MSRRPRRNPSAAFHPSQVTRRQAQREGGAAGAYLLPVAAITRRNPVLSNGDQ